MRGVIIAGGDIKDHSRLRGFLRQDDIIICADSGYEHAVVMGLDPVIIVGDMDSIAEAPDDVPIVRYPERKDFSDTELALDWARERGLREFLFFGVTGNRMDHTLSNILMLTDILNRGEYAEIVDDYNRIIVTQSSVSIDEPPGTLLSLVPVTDCVGVTTQNLEYLLHDEPLLAGHARGVSNVILKSPAGISLRDGTLLVIAVRE